MGDLQSRQRPGKVKDEVRERATRAEHIGRRERKGKIVHGVKARRLLAGRGAFAFER